MILIQVNEFARVILGKALQLIIQLEENGPAGATLERMSNQVSKEITVFDAFTELNSSAIRKVTDQPAPPYERARVAYHNTPELAR